jgi:hypothetical protein
MTYANAFRREDRYTRLEINAATPGHFATGQRTPGRRVARIVVHLATLPSDGRSGGFINDEGHLPW